MTRWSETDARDWGRSKPWTCGFNFLPSSAVNFLEMWHAATFDLPTIERELGWAGAIGFNAIRVNLHPLVWNHDRDGLMDRLDRLMAVADRHGISTVPTLFDDCGFGGAEPVWARQPDPVPGVHNSRAIAAPGRAAVRDPAARPALERYVRDIIATFRTDPRVLFWDLYNEPGNRMEFSAGGFTMYDAGLEPASLSLMEAAFDWARAEAPEQPLSVAAWVTPLPGEDAHPYQTEIDRTALALSDIVTFHAYWAAEQVERFIDYLEPLNRPMLCTEWMARAVGSRIADQLPLFHERDVGCFQWGLVRGRTQTHLPWPAALVSAHGGTTGDEWFHDLLHPDGTPYDQAEVETIRALTGAQALIPNRARPNRAR
ncbi:1,4-beta-xylanase [Jannaschia seohaensis]|uniref:Cellulase (Glycosyl hydrolase family 5) n=1 Tax=Jannaschia seohaensis TaxID=475081 RepID=A0A2Y9AFF2_9RHOB|nr:1,4-beta-xylanase [Jannaschia seohaensis]PWJ21402.1 hypothetical protein BCF38_102655 [Jannaschia seohaensis]SSA42008.1 hypothetical protein SAMN05421539_102655 [Jannaschia seohaensis]